MADVSVREAQAVLQSLQAGVVPRDGLQHLAVGRVAEVRQALWELEALDQGGGVFKVVAGDYGSGKTFFLSLVRQVALARGYLVADADLAPDLRLRGEGRGLGTYRQLTARLSSDSRRDGGALQVVLDRWADQVRAGAAERLGGAPPGGRTPAAAGAVDRELRDRLRDIQEQPGGFSLAAVLRRHFEASLAGDEDGRQAALRFLRGELRTPAEARALLRMAGLQPIGDATWYEHLRLLALLSVQAGYRGLLVMLDEGVNLYRIAQPESRAANYEVVLRLLNDALQGRAPHLGVYLAGPPEMVSDARRGLYSYPALRTRLQANPLADADHRDLAQPVLTLSPLTPDELLALLLKVRTLHAGFYGPTRVDAGDAEAWLGRLLARPGAGRFLTVREALRSFIQALNVLQQHPGLDKAAALGEAEEHVAQSRFVDVEMP